MDRFTLPGLDATHARVVLTDSDPSRDPLVVEIFPDRLAPKEGWTRNDLALGFLASLCCPVKDGGGKGRRGWHATADGEWMAKLDEAKGPFQHPCGTIANGAFFVARGAKVGHTPTFHLDHNGPQTTVVLPNGDALPMERFRGTPYRQTNASPAVTEWVRLTAFTGSPKMRGLQCLLALAEGLDGEPVVEDLVHSAAPCVLTVLEDLLHGVSQGTTVGKIVAQSHPTSPSTRWHHELRDAQNTWLVGPDRPWAARTYQRHLAPALTKALERRPIATTALAQAARLLWQGWQGQTPPLHQSAHAVLHAHGLVEQARSTLAS
jgi:hypothetical protein